MGQTKSGLFDYYANFLGYDLGAARTVLADALGVPPEKAALADADEDCPAQGTVGAASCRPAVIFSGTAGCTTRRG
ncbi:MAG: hypothetical protein LBR00_01330 [Clostridiales Family XIII bacterium]|nr:hypothetical protein [Clostridiales Family XIII bacterium]